MLCKWVFGWTCLFTNGDSRVLLYVYSQEVKVTVKTSGFPVVLGCVFLEPCESVCVGCFTGSYWFRKATTSSLPGIFITKSKLE